MGRSQSFDTGHADGNHTFQFAVQVVCSVEGGAAVVTGRGTHTSFSRATKAVQMSVAGALSLLNRERWYAEFRPSFYDLVHSGRSGHEKGLPLQHHVNRFGVQEKAMFDGVNASPDGVFDPRGALRMGSGEFAGLLSLFNSRAQLLESWSSGRICSSFSEISTRFNMEYTL